MKKTKPKIIVILGPTASGKSDLAVSIAKKFGGEIISADSRQVYKGLDIGSGKITKKEMRGVPHHLLDVISPKKIFTVQDFKKLSEEKIKKITNKKRIPIVCGGTGFYIDTLVKNIILPEVKADIELRKKLEKKDTETLFKLLKKKDKKRAQNIDPHNKVRIIRALEIIESLGKVPKIKSSPTFDVLQIGIEWDKEKLRERINKRLISRIKSGMIKEVENLHKNGISWKRLESLGLEYRYCSLFIQKKITKEQMVFELQNKIWQYAKRQLVWFKRDESIVWIKPSGLKKIEEIVGGFWGVNQLPRNKL